jgi:hypothetical protein
MEKELALTRSVAAQIVETVEKDAECKKRIPKVYGARVLGNLGIAGSLRNLANPKMFVVPNYQPTQEESDLACTGIAEATSKALNARAKKEVSFPVAKSDSVSRESQVLGVHHTATSVTLRTGESFVFDWHATLMIGNPMIHPSVDAWMHDVDGILYSQWTGRQAARGCFEPKKS